MFRFRGLRPFLVFTFILAMATAGFAFPPPEGRGGGGGKDDDSTSDPPPVTYMIAWVEDFNQLQEMNDDSDFIGQIPSLYGVGNISPTMGLIYAGERYVLDDLFVGTGAGPRYLFGLSNRLDDGSIWLCGSCDTIDGVRGWRMLVSPATNGLERVSFSILQPAEGDDTSALRAINMYGESVGYSYSTAELNANGATNFPVLYCSDLETVVISDTGSRDRSFITDSGTVICPLEGHGHSGYYAQAFGIWSPVTALQILLDTADIGADAFRPVNFSAVGDFLFDVYETIDQKGTQTTTTYLYNLYDGSVNTVPEPSTIVRDLNSFGDLIISGGVNLKRNRTEEVREVYFANLDIIEDVNNMLDPYNLQEDLDRWFGTEPRLYLFNDFGVIVGNGRDDNVDFEFSVVLVPVSP